MKSQDIARLRSKPARKWTLTHTIRRRELMPGDIWVIIRLIARTYRLNYKIRQMIMEYVAPYGYWTDPRDMYPEVAKRQTAICQQYKVRFYSWKKDILIHRGEKTECMLNWRKLRLNQVRKWIPRYYEWIFDFMNFDWKKTSSIRLPANY